jgi:Raf kinase inhibitor-like YbhB/YbcL family protein
MIITSPSFAEGSTIPRKFSCEGGDINPELQIQNVPEGAKSLALVVHDPDAPVAGGFTHWTVWNIDPSAILIKEESVPPGATEGVNGTGRMGYMGPCPPPGPAHRYEFHLYALDASLDLAEGASHPELTDAMAGHILEEAILTGLYARE